MALPLIHLWIVGAVIVGLSYLLLALPLIHCRLDPHVASGSILSSRMKKG